MKALVKCAVAHFKVIIMTVNPFPSRDEKEQAVVDSWDYACEKFGVDYDLSDDVEKLVSDLRYPLEYANWFLRSANEIRLFEASSSPSHDRVFGKPSN